MNSSNSSFLAPHGAFFKVGVVVVTAATVVVAASSQATLYYPFNSAGVAYDINSATVFTLTPDVGSAGTGTFGGFLTVNDNTAILEGISTSSATVMPQVSASQTDALPFSSLAAASTTINGSVATYYSFALDLNEPNSSDSYISVETVQIYSASSSTLPASSLAGFLGNAPTPTLVWDMDGDGDVSLLVDETITPGSGVANLIFAVPTSFFAGVGASDFLFIRFREGAFGVFGGFDYGNAGGFEEFGLHSGTTDFDVTALPDITVQDTEPPSPQPGAIPEPGTWMGGVGLVAGVLCYGYRRRRAVR